MDPRPEKRGGHDILAFCSTHRCGGEKFWKDMVARYFPDSVRNHVISWERLYRDLADFINKSLYFTVESPPYTKREDLEREYFDALRSNQKLLTNPNFFFFLPSVPLTREISPGRYYFYFPVARRREDATKKEFLDFYDDWLGEREAAEAGNPPNTLFLFDRLYGVHPGFYIGT